HVFSEGQDDFDNLALAPNNRWVVGVKNGPFPAGNTAYVWDLHTGKQQPPFKFTRGWDRTRLLSFLPDGSAFVFSEGKIPVGRRGYDYNVYVVDVPSGKVRQSVLGLDLRGGAGAVSPDGKTLALSGYHETASLYDLKTG